MIRGTTPYIKFNVSGTDLSDITDILITFEAKNYEMTKRGSDIIRTVDEDDNPDGGFYVRLTQEETLALPVGKLTLQVKMINTNNDVVATSKFSIRVEEALYEEVIEA